MQKVSVWKKFYMIYDFFIARRIVWTFYTLFFFSVVVPVSVFFPEVRIPVWELIYIPAAISLLTSVGTPRLDIDHCMLLCCLKKMVLSPTNYVGDTHIKNDPELNYLCLQVVPSDCPVFLI